MKHVALLSSVAIASFALTGIAASVDSTNDNAAASTDKANATVNDHVVELAICLDTSGSMDGLINSARQKLWTIVNDLATAEPTPKLRVALLSYGNDGHHEENGWVNVETPFTEDLDTVSEMLFGLTTNGGTELVGRVVQTSLQELDWHPSEGALRMIFVAGNESANQDEKVAAHTICKDAAARGIDVNSIYCVYNDDDSEVLPGWRELASSGNGAFAQIDQNNGSVVIATRFDPKLIALSSALNDTYIPFGAAGEAGCRNQWVQDANAVQLNSANAASRAATKAGKLYNCSWDLVDATRNGEIKLEDVDVADLPEDMRELTHEQRLEKIESMLVQRTELQTQIASLDQRRQKLLNAELARQAHTNIGSFDLAIRTAIRTKAKERGFAFTPLGRTDEPADAPAPTQDSDSAEYFVQFGGGGMDVWISRSIVEEYEDTRTTGGSLEHDTHIEPGTPEAAAFIGTLPTDLQDLVRSLTGVIYLHWQDRIYLITGGC